MNRDGDNLEMHNLRFENLVSKERCKTLRTPWKMGHWGENQMFEDFTW